MFERYTEKARRVIFFARYEASEFGTPAIEAEHILLGLLREDRALIHGLYLDADSDIEAIRKEIAARSLKRVKVPASVDLPLSPSAKSVLSYAADESERFQHRHIGTVHLLLGLIQEEQSLASEILRARGITVDKVEACLESAWSDSPSHGISEITPEQLSQRLKTLADRLAQQGVFTHQEFSEQLFCGKDAFLHLEASFNLLLNLLVSKGIIGEDERRDISTGQS